MVNIQENYALRQLNTFGIDVTARQFASITTTHQLQQVLAANTNNPLPLLVLGGGSNLLFTRPVNALVLHLGIEGIEVTDAEVGTVFVTAGAGVVWHQLVMYCVHHGYGGIENLALIPGRVGAAPMQNIGAYGVELKDVFHSLSAVRIADGSIHQFALADCQFGYRESVFKRHLAGQFIITSVTLKLSTQPTINTSYGAIKDELAAMHKLDPTIDDVCAAVINIRSSKLPDPAVLGNAGSFFKNPVVSHVKFQELKARYPEMPSYPAAEGVKLAAGWLIEKCGWKGKRVGNTGCHAAQALVIVNYGGASGAEILDHALRVTLSVSDKFGVTLEREVNVF